jgi:hypothetical protein
MWQHMLVVYLIFGVEYSHQHFLHRAASKDLELESTYIKLLKETSTHEKSISRDLGR